MQSLVGEFLNAQPVTQGLLQTVRRLGEHRGRQTLFQQQSPQVLATLQQAAIVRSTESSNRIEGVVAPANRLAALVEGKTTPRNRSEQEIAGYRDVLATIHASSAHIPFTENVVLQLHRDLFQYLPQGIGGHWKTADNQIMEKSPDGTQRLRFQPTPAFQTPEAMRLLHERYRTLRDAGTVEPLLLFSAYILDFLCVHPFNDGNGRMSRLLTLLLLYQNGYDVGRYISLEQIVERTKEGYYDALHASSQGWHEGKHTLLPWWEYFLGVVLLTAYRDLEERVGVLTGGRGGKRAMVIACVGRLPHEFKVAEIERACPEVSRPTINRVLQELKRAGEIRPLHMGRDAVWEKSANFLQGES